MTDFGFSETYDPEWVVEGVIARAQRPGYPVNRPSPQRVEEWAAAVLELGIRSVLCIVDSPQLGYYEEIGLQGGGLLPYYRSLGLAVEHIPAEDYKTQALSPDELRRVWDAFERLEKPLLVHCSAGRDRTGAALEHILSRRQSIG